MAMKYAVKTLDEVPEAMRGEYVEDKELGFKLALDGAPEDPAELRRAKQRETEGRKTAEAKLKELTDAQVAKDEELRKANEEAARKSGDVAAIEKSWKDKHESDMTKLRTELEGKNQYLNSNLSRVMIDGKATEIASEIAIPGSLEVLMPHLRNRLRIEERDGELTTIVLDTAGKPSAMSLADLKKEFQANKAFAGILVASRASGGGATGGKGGGAAGPNVKTRAEFEAMSAADKVDFTVKKRGTITD